MSRVTSDAIGKNAMSVLEAEGNRLEPMAAEYENVEVSINLGPAFDQWLVNYYDFLEFVASEKAHPLGFSLEYLKRYVATLIDSRVKWVRRDKRRVLHFGDQIAVPTLLHVALSGIGRVESEDLGITFVPTFESEVELLTREECEEVTRRLRPLQHLGVSFAFGFTREHEGVADLMTMQFLRNHLGSRSGVFNHTPTPSKAYAVLAYILDLKQVLDLLGPARVIYADESTLSARLFEVLKMEQKVA